MPWKTQGDVARHNKRAAKSPRKARKWRKTANALLEKGYSEASAIRIANSQVGHEGTSRAHRMYGGKGAR